MAIEIAIISPLYAGKLLPNSENSGKSMTAGTLLATALRPQIIVTSSSIT
jgi:hypothetical protein